MFEEGMISRTVQLVIKELSEAKKKKDTKEDFAIATVEDQKDGEEYKLFISFDAFTELQEEDLLYAKYLYAKPSKYEPTKMVLSLGKHGQIIMVPKKRRDKEKQEVLK